MPNPWDKSKIEKICELCKKKFFPWKRSEGKFCGAICQRVGRKIRPAKMVEFSCKCCGGKVIRPKYDTDINTKFCSIQCMANVRGEGMRREKHYRWKGGDHRTGSRPLCDRIKKSVGKCEKCDSTQNLQTHHKIKVIDRPDLVADPSNIEVICVECHAQEHPEFAGMLLKKKTRYEEKCKRCESTFLVQKYKIGKRRFCSLQCSIKNAKEVWMVKYGRKLD